MVDWNRVEEQTVGHFREWEIQRVRRHMTEFRALLCTAEEWRGRCGPAGLAGSLPAFAPDSYRRAMAIIRWRTDKATVDATEFYQERDCLGQMRIDAETVLRSLRGTDGTVVLADPDHVNAWVWSLYERGMDIAFGLGTPWETYCRTDVAPAGDIPGPGQVINWLLSVVEGLVDVADIYASVSA